MTRRDRILVLLEHYRDVLEGIGDSEPGCSGDCSLDDKDRWLCEHYGCADERVLALMCRAYNHSSYRQLERLLRLMWERWPRSYVQIQARFVRYSERRVAWCRKCGKTLPAHKIGTVHGRCRIKGRLVTLEPRVERVPAVGVDPARVTDAVDWLEQHWQGVAEIPPDVAQIERERELRKVAAA